MKKITSFLLLALVVLGTSCKDYLDVNTNPNQATDVAPRLIMPQALTATASILNTFNSYGMQLGGYGANAGGYGGFGENINYKFSSNSYTGLWDGTYDNLEDYQYIINKTEGNATYLYYNAAARIMKAHDFQLLVDTYNSVPYFGALKGSSIINPSYDDPAQIYASLANQLDSAITIINSAQKGVVEEMGNYDVLFKGDMTSWKKLANTIKLRLLVRGNGKVTFSNKTFDATGFLTTDALINPGYTRDNGRQNPEWSTWGYSYTGSAANKAWMPSTYIFGFYDGHTLTDTKRGAAIYYQFPSTGTNRLGYENVSVPSSPTGSFWYSGTNRDGTAAGTVTGVLKGPNAGFPLITASESYFLQAEGVVRSILSTGDAKTLFQSGITASFNYLYQLPDKTISGNPTTDATDYIAANTGKYIVNFDLATSIDQKIEAIITQKYIALNMVNSNEGWNEYRRTGYPTQIPGGSAYQTFASIVSESTRADKLPTRLMYPTSEVAYNSAKMPQGITTFTSLIFWAK